MLKTDLFREVLEDSSFQKVLESGSFWEVLETQRVFFGSVEETEVFSCLAGPTSCLILISFHTGFGTK